jgi:hypothetical protein
VKTCTRVRWALIVSLTAGELLPLVVPSGPTCVTLSGLYPCKVGY